MIKLSPRYTRNIQNGTELKLGGNWQFIQAKDETNGIMSRMKGNMASVFGNYSTRINKIMLSAGLTMQYNWTDIEVQDAVNDYNKLYVCPQANLMWMLSPKRGTRLMIMYQHSVDEMPYSLITSARTYASTTHYTTGNPNLKTPSTHQIMTQFAVNKNMSFTAIVARGLNSIFFINEQDKDDKRITASKPVNAYHIQLWGLGGEYLAKPFKWWDTKIQARAQNMMTSSEIINSNGNICGLFWWNNNFNFTPTFGGGLHAYWETSSKFDDRTMKPVGSINMSLWKTLMNNRLYISVDANLWSKGRQYTVTANGFQRYYHNATKTHWAGVTVKWNFKGGKSYHSREEAESLQRYNKIEEKK